MSEKLKPCPFCGSRDVDVLDACGDPYSFSLPYVHCNNCNADSKMCKSIDEAIAAYVHCNNCNADSKMCKSIDEAIAAWNRRADKVKVVAQVSLDEDKLRQLVDEAMKNVAVEYAQPVKDALKELEYCGERGEPMPAYVCRELAGDMKEACDD